MVTVSVYVIVAPGATTAAEAVCVIDRSAPLTVTDALAELFAEFGSVPVSETVAVLVIVDPPGAAAMTVTTIVKLPVVELAAMFPLAVQTIDPVPPTAGTVPQVQPAGGVAETNVVFAGVLCVSVALAAATVRLLFVTVSVYVMFAPVATGFGAAATATDRSGVAPTVTTFDASVLFPGVGSDVVELIVAEFVIVVPTAVPEFIRTT